MDFSTQAKERREKLLSQMSEQECLLLFSSQEKKRSKDFVFSFRQDSYFYYLAPFLESNFAALLLRPDFPQKSILFVESGDEQSELWDGKKCCLSELKERLQLDAVYAWEDWKVKTKAALKGIQRMYCPDSQILESTKKIQNPFSCPEVYPVFKELVSTFSSLELVPVQSLMDEMRLFKSKEEIQCLKKAAEISGKAHCAVMSSCEHGKKEQELYGTFLQTVFKEGADGEAFPSIVAAGVNACTLHYRGKECMAQSGQLLLLDAGAEYQLYAGDITRTFPVDGVFKGVQKEVYSGLLELQKRLIALVSPSNNFKNLQEECVSGIVDLLLDWKVLKGNREEVMASKEYHKYFPHRVGHWLGLDVHDVGSYDVNGNPKPFVENMALTIEPGLYFHPKHTQHLSQEWQGLGLRIEDDILVNKKGHEVLSAVAPKEIGDIESLMGSG